MEISESKLKGFNYSCQNNEMQTARNTFVLLIHCLYLFNVSHELSNKYPCEKFSVLVNNVDGDGGMYMLFRSIRKLTKKNTNFEWQASTF